jgi:hypothetical protein
MNVIFNLVLFKFICFEERLETEVKQWIDHIMWYKGLFMWLCKNVSRVQQYEDPAEGVLTEICREQEGSAWRRYQGVLFWHGGSQKAKSRSATAILLSLIWHWETCLAT